VISQLRRDLAIALALSQELEDLQLASAQRHTRHAFRQPCPDGRRDPSLAGVHGPDGRGSFVLFQSSEGEPDVPVLVPVRIAGNNIEFALPKESPYAGRFAGTLSRTELSGKFDGGQEDPHGGEVIRLKRGKSYWQ